MTMKKNREPRTFLFEDHHQTLKLWREEGVKNLDLVHIDAHIDFDFYAAKPIEKAVVQAQDIQSLKEELEKSLVFMRYEKNFDRQANIGNYIYPAICEGIIKNFYWVVPGGLKEFRESHKFIRNLLKKFSRRDLHRLGNKGRAIRQEFQDGIVSSRLLGRKFVICTLDKLPILKSNILLDIDTDFLVVDSLKNTGSTFLIGKRKPWILPNKLVEIIRRKAKSPEIITIAYSVNGGYTPIGYKHLGDEIAYIYSPNKFKDRYRRIRKAAQYFNLFNATGREEHYQKAVALNPAYRVADNNYGPLYLAARKFSRASREFSKILKVDRHNPACLMGLGNIALERNHFKKARGYFQAALAYARSRLFDEVKKQSLFGLAKAELKLKHFNKAKRILMMYRKIEPLSSQASYFLGYILEKQNDFSGAARCYRDVVMLGFGGIEPLYRLLKISSHFDEKDDIINFISLRYKKFKTELIRRERKFLKKKSKGLYVLKRKMSEIEQGIRNCKALPAKYFQ